MNLSQVLWLYFPRPQSLPSGGSTRGQEFRGPKSHCRGRGRDRGAWEGSEWSLDSRHLSSLRPACPPGTTHATRPRVHMLPAWSFPPTAPGTQRGPTTHPRPCSHAATPARGFAHAGTQRGQKGAQVAESPRAGRRGSFIGFKKQKTFSGRRPRVPAPRRWPAGRQSRWPQWRRAQAILWRTEDLVTPEVQPRLGTSCCSSSLSSLILRPPLSLPRPDPTCVLVYPCRRGVVLWSRRRGGERRA